MESEERCSVNQVRDGVLGSYGRGRDFGGRHTACDTLNKTEKSEIKETETLDCGL